MNIPLSRIALLLELSFWAKRRAEPFQADKLLMLAAVSAFDSQLPCLANCIRLRILAHNQNHAIGRFPHTGVALEDEGFQILLNRAASLFPVERCERLAAEMGIDVSHRCEEFADRRDYFAAILETSRFELDDSLEESDW